MPQPFTHQHIFDLEAVLSAPRFATYLRAAAGNRQRAAALYYWNTEVSAAFYTPLQFAEIGTRNGAVEAIVQEFGPDWHRNRGFQFTVKEKIGRHLRPRRDLMQLAARLGSAGSVVAELKFAFWQHLFVAAQDRRLWEPHVRTVFPGTPAGLTVQQARQQIHDDVQAIRDLRNRIAHHEPIIARRLGDDLARTLRLLEWRRPSVATWLQGEERVTALLRVRP